MLARPIERGYPVVSWGAQGEKEVSTLPHKIPFFAPQAKVAQTRKP